MSRRSLILVAVAVGLVAWLVLRGGDDVTLTADEPQIVSVGQLESFAADADHPIYWVGERPDVDYELTETASGRIFVRYLEDGAEAGDRSARFVTVGTYPVRDGVRALRRAAGEEGRELARSDDGAVVLIDTESSGNAHIAHRGDDLQVEVFSPEPGEALRLAARGAVEPVR